MLLKKIYQKVFFILNCQYSRVRAFFFNPYIDKKGSTFKKQMNIDVINNITCDFDVFNKTITLDNPLWDKDFIHDVKWEKKWHKVLPYKKRGRSDVKVPWEFGRGSVFTQSALISCSDYTTIGNYKSLVYSFYKNNIAGYGVQWQCTMDVSIRLVNILVSKMMLNQFTKVDDQCFEKTIGITIREHFKFISSNLEVFNGSLKNNHYLADILGKVWYFCYVEEDEAQLIKLLDEMDVEYRSQYLKDGSNFEGSISYHFLSTEIFILTLLPIIDFYKSKQKPFTHPSLITILVNAINFANFATSSLGFPSRIGDDDSGVVIRPVKLSNIAINKKNQYITINRLNAFNSFLKFYYEQSNVNYTQEIVGTLLGLKEISFNKVIKQKTYDDFGLYKYEKSGFELFFRHLKELGTKGLGGHNHQDDTSFELFFEGFPYIVDPGTYCYTSEPIKRNQYRSSFKHNLVKVNDNEQFDMLEGQKGLFKLDNRLNTRSDFKKGANKDSITTNRMGLDITRTIDKKTLSIIDFIDTENGVARFHLHPSLKVIKNDKGVVVNKVQLIFESQYPLVININKYYYSDYYLNEEKASVIEVLFHRELITCFERV